MRFIKLLSEILIQLKRIADVLEKQSTGMNIELLVDGKKLKRT